MHQPINDLTREKAATLWALDEPTGFILDAKTGARVDVPQHDGYRLVRGFGRSYKAHRIAWLLHFGKWPDGLIDHISGVRTDNRIANLRDVSQAENQRNQRCHREATAKASRDRKFGTCDRNTGESDISPRDTLARARLPTEGMSRCHTSHGVTSPRDSDKPGPEAGPVTITQSTSEVRRQKDRARLMADPRFAQWAAGSAP